MPCENCVNRREFLATAAAAAGVAGLAALSGCGDGQLSGVSNTTTGGGNGGGMSSPLVVTVSSFPGLANVGQLVQLNAVVAAKRTGASTFDAFDLHCTHQRCLVNVSSQRFDCPCHFSAFASDGSVINGPAASPLEKLPTSYDSTTDQLTIG
jgi:Rieske Fe-S protein